MSVRTGVAGLVMVVVVVVTLAGCGVPVDGEVHSFPPDAIPYGLAESPSTISSRRARVSPTFIRRVSPKNPTWPS